MIDYIQGRWTYVSQDQKVVKPGAKEEALMTKEPGESKPGNQENQLKQMQRQLAMQEIAERHITEFAGN